MPTRYQIVLPGLDPATIRLEHLHAVVSGWLDAPDAHRAPAKPYTITPAAEHPDGTAIEVALLDDTLNSRLTNVAGPGRRVRLGRAHTTVIRPPQRIAEFDWQHPPGTARAWSLRFVTPTTFRRGNVFTPNPSPHSILSSLHRSWTLHAPPGDDSPIAAPATSAVWLTDIDVTSHVLRLNGLTVSGFTGRLRITCDPDTSPADRAVIDRLIALAPYSGVGAYTTRGLGVTRPEPTWPTPPARLTPL